MNLRALLREFFLRKEGLARASAVPETRRASAATYQTAAARRLSAAQELRGSGQVTAALVLYREAANLAVLAVLAFKGRGEESPALPLDAAVERLESAIRADGLELPAQLARVRPMLASTDPFAVDRIPESDALAQTKVLDLVIDWLFRVVDTRSPAQLKAERAARVIAAFVATIGATSWLAVRFFSPPNIALHRPVRASGQAYGTSPEGAVDGEKSAAYDFHSSEDDSPWLSIDLGQRYAINRVKIFGRTDCCFDQSVPLALEASDDGISFRKIAERTEPFSGPDPWVVRNAQAEARFLRLRVERRSYLVLSEVEVRGTKKP
jgi:hypothetical protein